MTMRALVRDRPLLPATVRRTGRLRTAIERDGLTVSVLAFWGIVLALAMPYLVNQDSWLAFVDGRLIAGHGLPHVDTLTVWTLGRHWIDQQWAAHLLLYEAVDHGGLGAAILLGIACVLGALGGAAFAARRLGASPGSAALMLSLPVLATPWLAEVRSQSFGLVPFVVVYGLLAADSRAPGRRVLFVLPVLAVWANFHGSVSLGAALAALYGLSRVRTVKSRVRGAALFVGAPLCVLASPYGLGLLPYYRLMLLHPPLARYVTEWQPPAVQGSTVLFFVSVLVAAALWVRAWRQLTTFERWAIPLLVVAALSAVRNGVWFELAAVVSLPRLIDAAWPSRIEQTPQVRRVNVALAVAAVVAVALVFSLQLTRAPGWLDAGRSASAAAAVARAAGSNGVVLADDRHADWLLWLEPALAGRVAYDVRFELFDGRELRQLKLLDGASHPVWQRCGAAARVVTFAGPKEHGVAVREGVLAHGSKTIARSATFVAVAQPPAGRQLCRL